MTKKRKPRTKREQMIRKEELAKNPSTRVPICLCLDTSGSMDGAPIKELTKGINLFYEAIQEDTKARYAADICLMTFDNEVKVIEEFASISSQKRTYELEANGITCMGEAVNQALDLLEERKSEYNSEGIPYFQPWLVLMTDGAPNGDHKELARAIERTTHLIDKEKLVMFPIGIGEGADMETLKQLSPRRLPLKLQGLKFKEFFTWLGKSVEQTSRSKPTDKIPLDVELLSSWASL